MKVMKNLLKDEHDTFLINTTVHINETNPVVDRIMDGETVDTVIMANKEGSPILTNINLPVATRYSQRMLVLGSMVQHMLKELAQFIAKYRSDAFRVLNHLQERPVHARCYEFYATLSAGRRCGQITQNTTAFAEDPFDEALVFRLKSFKEEVLVTPHQEFSIMVVQRDRKVKEESSKVQSESRRISSHSGS